MQNATDNAKTVDNNANTVSNSYVVRPSVCDVAVTWAHRLD